MNRKNIINEIRKVDAYLIAKRFADIVGADEPEYSGDKFKFKSQVKGDTTNINIYGAIMPFDSGLDVVEKIQDVSTPKISVNINSPGGDLMAGRSIANALMNSEAEVTTIVNGLAASAASIIFAAGDKRIMNQGSLLMIHNAMGGMIVFGNKETLNEGKKDIDELINVLSKADAELVKTYASISNLNENEITKAMQSETFYDPKESLDNGLATEISRPKKQTNKKNSKEALSIISEEAVKLMQKIF